MLKRTSNFSNDKATLYIIATPIGNLQEITPRCKETLELVDVVFCEDTRVSAKIMNHLQIKKPLQQAYKNVEKQAEAKIIDYLENGKNVALMSDAGYPCISDPGQPIVASVIKLGFNVVVINGPNAALHALVGSGFNSEHFYYYGFLDAKKTKRLKQLESLKCLPDTLVFYQSPHKVKECLEDIMNVLGDRNICLCRELSKKYEEFLWGNISEIIPICEELKGEMVLVVEGYKVEEYDIDSRLFKEIETLIDLGISKKEAIKKTASKYSIPKNKLYDAFHKKEGNENG